MVCRIELPYSLSWYQRRSRRCMGTLKGISLENSHPSGLYGVLLILWERPSQKYRSFKLPIPGSIILCRNINQRYAHVLSITGLSDMNSGVLSNQDWYSFMWISSPSFPLRNFLPISLQADSICSVSSSRQICTATQRSFFSPGETAHSLSFIRSPLQK